MLSQLVALVNTIHVLIILAKSSVHTTWCISSPLLLDTSVIQVLLKLLMNCSGLESFHIVSKRRKQLLFSRL